MIEISLCEFHLLQFNALVDFHVGNRTVGDCTALGHVELVSVSLELCQATLLSKLLILVLFVAIFSFLWNVVPPANSHSDSASIVILSVFRSMVDLFYIVKTLPRLDRKEAELIECRRNSDGVIWARDTDALPILLLDKHRWVQTQSSAPFLPPGTISVRKVQDVADPPTANNVIMTQKMTSWSIHIDGHICFPAAQFPRSSYF